MATSRNNISSIGSVNINNLNILTFIKDIYQSLKHFDILLNQIKDNMESRISKLEDNNQIIITRLENIENLLTKLNESSKETNSLDKTLEYELLEKMKNLNNISPDDKLNLKPNELTIGNILENNYSFLDINNSISNNEYNQLIENNLNYNLDNEINNTEIQPAVTNKETLHSLLF